MFGSEINSYDPTTGNPDSQWMAGGPYTAVLLRSQTHPTVNILREPKQPLPQPGNCESGAQPCDSWTDRPLGAALPVVRSARLGSGYNSYWQIVQSQTLW